MQTICTDNKSNNLLWNPPENSRQLLFETIWGYRSYNAWHWKFRAITMHSEAAGKTTDSTFKQKFMGRKKK